MPLFAFFEGRAAKNTKAAWALGDSRRHAAPFIIEENLKLFYYRGLKEREKGYLMDTCLTARNRCKAYLDYFRIPY